MSKRNLLIFASIFIAVASAQQIGSTGPEPPAKGATEATSPVKGLADRGVYYPGTEDLAPDEMRVIACGTGHPMARPKQAASCWLVELGNGDKFIFDLGSQSLSRIAAMKIPMDFLDKVFISHLHVDHMGDLPDFWTISRKMNRTVPLRVWGPSGATPELGTKAAIEALKKFLLWGHRRWSPKTCRPALYLDSDKSRIHPASVAGTLYRSRSGYCSCRSTAPPPGPARGSAPAPRSSCIAPEAGKARPSTTPP